MEVEFLFLVVASIIGMGFISNYIFEKTNVPDILLLLLLGLLIGPVLNLFPRDLFITFVPYISGLALLMILFNGGLNLNLDKLIHKVPQAATLAVLGFLLSSLSVGALSFVLFDLKFLVAILLGVIVGGVSSAIVIPIVSELEEFREDLRLTLDIESVITDPLCIIVAIVLMDIITGRTGGTSGQVLSPVLSKVISMFSVSIVVGLVTGFIWLEFLQHIKGEKYHYMLTLSYLFLVYAMTQILGGNGAIASFMVGIVLGNGKRIGKMLRLKRKYYGLTEKTKSFQDQVSFFVKTFFFVILGMTITFSRPYLFLVGAFFTAVILLSRLLAVEISVFGTDYSRIEKNIMTSMMPRGLAAAVLASVPLLEYGIEGSRIFPEIVFSVILGTAFVSTVGVFVVERELKGDGENPEEGKGEEEKVEIQEGEA